MSAVTFTATLQLNGKTATGVEVPEEVVAALDSGRKPRVRVTIGGHSYPSTVAVMNGRYMLPVSAENRDRAGVAAGDEITVRLEPDSGPREVTLPADFAAALDTDPRARQFFDQISYSDKRWHVLAIEGAKKIETRQRRIEKSIAMLREHRAR